MPVNFFDETQKTSSSISQFGLCDDQPPAENPAYIDEQNRSSWIGIINNSANEQVDFYPIDHCVPLYRQKKSRTKNQILRKIHTIIIQCFNLRELESRCDGVLRFCDSLIFVELKMRESGGWLKKGREQLTNTIVKFKQNHDITKYHEVEAYVCNSLRPLANTGNTNHIQQFRDETGLILNVQQNIYI
jgi:hypothetical protein